MSESPCPHSPDVAAYALGALDDDEAERFRAHLPGCPRCTAELGELQGAVDLLPAAVPPAVASPALKERVMSVVRSEAELLRAAGPFADRPAATETRRRRPARRRPWFTVAGAVGFAAAGALVAVIAVGLGGTSVRTTTGTATPKTASVVLRQSGGRSELDVIDMPAPPADHVYQVWLERAHQAPTPTDALFGVNRAGDAAVAVPGSLQGVQRVLVTAEPSGGSPTGVPSGPPVLTVDVTA